MNSKLPQSMQSVTFRHFDRKHYSAFNSLGRNIRIGVLSIATLTFANTESIAASPVQRVDEKATMLYADDDSNQKVDFKIEEGDLLFEIDNSGRANAVTEVTTGLDGLKISHVAIAVSRHGKLFALEAIRRGVVLTPIDSMLSRPFHSTIPCIAVGRLRDRSIVRGSVRRALKLLGKPYDVWFLPDNDAYYCSELVQKCFTDRKGNPVFETRPMTFCDRPGHTADLWQKHFERLGAPVPEGVEGTNPGDLSKSEKIRIVKLIY